MSTSFCQAAQSRVSANQALLGHDLQLLQYRCVHGRSVGREVLLDLADSAGSVLPEHMQDVEFRICRKACGRGRLASGHRFTVGVQRIARLR